MVIELLTYRIPLESIMANILTVCRLGSLNNNIIGSLPGVDFFHKCQNVLAVETKTLGGYRIAKTVKVLEHQSDYTSRRGLSFGNSILKIATMAGYENVALSLEIFAADGTAENGVAAIQHTFPEVCDLLKNWRDVTCRIFPDKQEFLNKFPNPMNMTRAGIAKHSWIMTDTCNTAQKFWKLLRKVIEFEAKESLAGRRLPDKQEFFE